MLVIKNSKIYTSAGVVYPKGDILIKDGKIARVSESIESADAGIIDAQGLVTIPGVIDAHNHIGLFNDIYDDQDCNEFSRNATPELDIRYSIDFASAHYNTFLESGITSSFLIPGSANVIGGLGCVVKNAGKQGAERVIRHPAAMKMALGMNPKIFHGINKKEAPMTRMKTAQIIIDALERAKQYMTRRELPEGNPGRPGFNQGLENLALVLKKVIPLKVHAVHYDMLTVFRISEMFDIYFTIDHVWGTSDYYNDFTSSKRLLGVLFGPMGYMPRTPGEIGKQDPYALTELDKRGVNCAIVTDGHQFDPDIIYLQAGEVTRSGCDIERVINMLTINPAKAIGIADRTGSIEEGKDADIAIFKGTPALDTHASVVYTLVDGNIVYSRK